MSRVAKAATSRSSVVGIDFGSEKVIFIIIIIIIIIIIVLIIIILIIIVIITSGGGVHGEEPETGDYRQP